jgi:hypothetical protein
VDNSATGFRDATLLAVSVVLGIGLTAVMPLLGLPIAAAGLAGLAYRRRLLLAAAVSSAGVAAVAVLSLANVVFAVPAVTVVLLAITLLPNVDVQVVGAMLVLVLTGAAIGYDFVVDRAMGTTIPAQVAKDTALMMNSFVKALGTSASPDVIAQLRSSMLLMQQAIWSTYFETAVIIAVLVIIAVAWAARRLGQPLNVPRLKDIDLSPHVLWPLVVGVFGLAASHGTFAWASLAGIVGLNLAMCARTLLFIQGMGVSAGVLDRSRIGSFGRIAGLIALALLDALTFAVTFAGLVDFWVNFRKLPRDGVPAVSTGEGPDNLK